MITPPVEPSSKIRSDCLIESKLGPEAADALFDRLRRGLSLKEAVRILKQEHSLTVSDSSVSRWVIRRREEASAQAVAALRERFDDTFSQALELENGDDALNVLLRANLLLGAQALFAAQASGDNAAAGQAARAFASVVGAAAKSEKLWPVYSGEAMRALKERVRLGEFVGRLKKQPKTTEAPSVP